MFISLLSLRCGVSHLNHIKYAQIIKNEILVIKKKKKICLEYHNLLNAKARFFGFK